MICSVVAAGVIHCWCSRHSDLLWDRCCHKSTQLNSS